MPTPLNRFSHLFNRRKWFPELHLNLKVVDVDQVRSERRVVVRVVPRPGGHALVVVREDPAETLSVPVGAKD